MSARTVLTAIACALVLLSAAAAQPMQAPQGAVQPGQEGKDVMWVPTPDWLVERMLRMANTTSRDFVIDLGSGDGRIPIAAAKLFGARSLGVEYDEALVAMSRRRASEQGVADRVQFLKADLFDVDLSRASVLTLYLLTHLNLSLRPRILDLSPGTRIVSHQFRMGEWEPDATFEHEDRSAYLWIVPARVAGGWALDIGGRGFRLNLEQRFQHLQGSISRGPLSRPLKSGRLRGDAIALSYVDEGRVERTLSGKVEGARIRGSKWYAVRLSD